MNTPVPSKTIFAKKWSSLFRTSTDPFDVLIKLNSHVSISFQRLSDLLGVATIGWRSCFGQRQYTLKTRSQTDGSRSEKVFISETSQSSTNFSQICKIEEYQKLTRKHFYRTPYQLRPL